jgi:hypothetical protein
MTKKDAFPVKAITGSGTSSDGANIFIELEHAAGNKVAFAMPPEVASRLIDQAALQIDACKKINPPQAGYISAYPAIGFAIGSDQKSGDTVLAMRFGLGGSITYLLPRQVADRLQVELGKTLTKLKPGDTFGM